jgi:hypothetical protein
MKTQDFENLVQAYLNSRLGLDGLQGLQGHIECFGFAHVIAV